jgi:hypothetical protein
MSAHPPPIPPDQRTDKGAGKVSNENPTKPKDGYSSVDRNLAEQGRQGASKQNTTNKGYQQDR